MITDRLSISDDEPQDSATLLRDLDQKLMRRAAAIENEFREISRVRKLIEALLSPGPCGAVTAPSLPELLGQGWGK